MLVVDNQFPVAWKSLRIKKESWLEVPRHTKRSKHNPAEWLICQMGICPSVYGETATNVAMVPDEPSLHDMGRRVDLQTVRFEATASLVQCKRVAAKRM